MAASIAFQYLANPFSPVCFPKYATTASRNRYLASKNASKLPDVAPIKTLRKASRVPVNALLVALANANPLPIVSTDPGTKRMVATQ